MIVSFFVPLGPAAGGWTAYPTLSTHVGQPGPGQTLWIVGVFLTGSASIMGAVNYITTVVRLRAPGMTYFRMPLTVWGLWLTAILNALFVPVLAAGVLLLFLDRVVRHPLLPRGRGRRRRAAATRSSTSTCSGSSATRRSTS